MNPIFPLFGAIVLSASLPGQAAAVLIDEERVAIPVSDGLLGFPLTIAISRDDEGNGTASWIGGVKNDPANTPCQANQLKCYLIGHLTIRRPKPDSFVDQWGTSYNYSYTRIDSYDLKAFYDFGPHLFTETGPGRIGKILEDKPYEADPGFETALLYKQFVDRVPKDWSGTAKFSYLPDGGGLNFGFVANVVNVYTSAQQSVPEPSSLSLLALAALLCASLRRRWLAVTTRDPACQAGASAHHPNASQRRSASVFCGRSRGATCLSAQTRKPWFLGSTAEAFPSTRPCA